MSNRAVTWAYQQTGLPSSPKFILVTLADFADEEWSCFPGQELLATMTGMSVETVRRAMRVLTEEGYLTRERRQRPNGSRTSDRYFLHRPTPKPPTGQNDRSEESAKTDTLPVNLPKVTGQNEGAILEPSGEPSDLSAGKKRQPAPEEESLEQKINRVTRVYTDQVKLSKFVAIRGIVRQAFRAGYDEPTISSALLRLAEARRTVTVDVLRYEIEGAPAFGREKPNRVQDGLALANQLAAEMNVTPIRQIGTAS